MLKHLRSILLLPLTVTVIVPTILMMFSRQVNIGWGWGIMGLVPVLLGVLLIGLGLILLTATIRLFMQYGQGTLAPWDPTEQLVVHGIYRYVRNPMISGVLTILLGEAVLFGSWWVFGWFVLFGVGNLIYIPLIEEPHTAQRFGPAYETYKAQVPAWIPRLTAWEGDKGSTEGNAAAPPSESGR
ncbi:MAG: isoprenylcysteine carboxylmethyltransferase family protein [Chloroflexi bacterium]|nr:isoprenylcysteine carboxylmethyltransferase family protein [Chloroflexota bacterium]